MPVVNDRDLLAVEPSVFVDGQAAGTALLSGADGVVAGTSLSSAGSDFEAAGIDAGHVAVVDGEALEVASRTQATALEVSRPRASLDDALIAPGAGTGLSFAVISFERVIAQSQRDVLRLLGLRADDPQQPLDDTNVMNQESLRELVGMESIARAFAAAAALAPADASLSARAMLYARRSAAALAMSRLFIDLDGDGLADAARTAATSVLRLA